jgi:hypothetical protein
MAGEMYNSNYDDYQLRSPLHIKASGQLSLEDYRRDLIETGELAKEAVASEVELDTSQD